MSRDVTYYCGPAAAVGHGVGVWLVQQKHAERVFQTANKEEEKDKEHTQYF